MRQYILNLVLLFVSIHAFSQSSKDEILFTVDKDTVYVSEFISMYQKNLDLVKNNTAENITEYLELYKNFKLKVREAKNQKLHENPVYLRELNNYTNQLAKNYITNPEVTNSLIEEAYNRLQTDVHAKHILIRTSENENPADTLKVYNQLLNLRDQAKMHGFNKVSMDLKSKLKPNANGSLNFEGRELYVEDLGYFTAFKMAYPFETVAYNTNIGKISMPFKTQFGYHILFVIDKRKSQGMRQVAHIMLADTNKQKAETIYHKLKQGESFASLAKQFSVDKSSASKGGLMEPFAKGDLRSNLFETEAFSLQKIDDFTKPFKTQFGWHIVQLKNKIIYQDFEKAKPSIHEKIKNDSRSQIISKKHIENLIAKYKTPLILKDKALFKQIIPANVANKQWQLPINFPEKEILFKIKHKTVYYSDFANFILKNKRLYIRYKNAENIVNKAYPDFVKESLLNYQLENLENENKDYAALVKEYQEGLLLFNIMEKEIWSKANTDTLQQKSFYKNHPENYYIPKRILGVIAYATKKQPLKQIQKMLKQNLSLNQIKSIANNNKKHAIIFTEGEINLDNEALPKQNNYQLGVSNIVKHHDGYSVFKINKILPKEQQTYKQAKGKVLSDYQDFMEREWIKALKKKYPIKVNNLALEQVKKQLQ